MNKTLTLRYALTAFCTAVLTLLIFLMPVQASAAYSAGTTYVVDCCSLVVRTAPNDGVAGYANEGTAFYVSKVSGDWLYADSISGTSGKTISGWVYAPLCAVSGTSSGNYSSSASGGSVPNYGVSSGTSVVVTAPESVTLRSSASKESDALDWIGNGVKLNVLASSNGFYQVNFAGKTGWISAKYAESVSGSKPSGKPAKPSAGTSSGTSSGAAQGSGELNFWKSYNYAEAYCYSPNPDYHYYEDGNCMTYISQILVAGGLPTTEEFRDEKHSFVRIVDFIPYMNRTYGIGKINAPSVEDIKAIIASLHEFNPMMGHRGCRLAVTYPEIAKMQTSAVIRAAINVKKNHPEWNLVPEIMIPLVGDVKELKYVKSVVVATADAEIAAAGVELAYEVGTMIEIPRACLTADEIAQNADFFCFGTNDLTQMTFGFSRDDAGKFLDAYYDTKIFENDPFARLDQTGVGKLMNMALTLGRPANPNLHVGICGEHGGDPTSVEFCHKIGLDYVSCSPFRVPIARLAAAQAAIAEMK